MALHSLGPRPNAMPNHDPEIHYAVPMTNHPAAAWVPLDTLSPWDKNPRDNDHKVPEAMASLRRFGFCAPIVAWTSRSMIVAGHARMKAMTRILSEDPALDGQAGANADLLDANRTLRESLTGPDVRHLPVRYREFRSLQEAEAYALRDNNSIGDWNEAELGAVLSDLHVQGTDISGLGWTDAQTHAFMEGPDVGDELAADQTADAKTSFAVIIECDGEMQQLEVIERAQSEGWKCRALI